MGRTGSILLIVAVVAASFLVYKLVSQDEPAPAPPTSPPVQAPAPVEKSEPAPPPVKPAEAQKAPPPVREDQAVMAAPGVPTEIAGVVQDSTQRPLAGAVVQLVRFVYDAESRKPLPIRFKDEIHGSTTTGEDGRYVFKDLTPNEIFALRALAPEHVSQTKDGVRVGVLANFTLRPGAAVSGRIVDKDTGEPVAGAAVKGWFRTAESVKDVNQLFRWEEKITADEKGQFRIEGAPIQTVKFLLFHDEYEDLVEDLEVVAGRVNEFTFKMTRGLVLEGRLVDDLSGQPVPNIRIAATNIFVVPKQQAKSDKDGRFRLTGLARGRQMFTFSGDGYTETRLNEEIGDGDNYDPQKDNVRVFRLKPAGRAAGIVVDSSGNPVDNADVYVARHTPLMWQVRNLSEVRTGADGRFLVKNLDADLPYKIAVFRNGFDIGVSAEVKVEAGGLYDGVEVTLKKAGSISGRVVDEVGAPIPAAVLEVEKPPFADVWFPPSLQPGQAGKVTAVTGDDGRYELTGLWPGAYHFDVVQEEHVPLEKQRVQIREPGEVVTRDFTLKIGRYIAGRVTGIDGNPAAGAVVTAAMSWSEGEKNEGSAVVDPEGFYRIKGLVKGVYRVKARQDGSSSKELFDIPSDSDGVNFELRANGSLSGAVVDASRSPVTAFTVSVMPEVDASSTKERDVKSRQGATTRSFNDPGGIFKIDDLEPGTYIVAVTAGRFARAGRGGVEVPSGGVGDTGVIVMPEGASFAGTVVDSGGAAVMDATITLWNLDAQERMRPDAKGGRAPEDAEKGLENADAGDRLPPGVEQITHTGRVDRDGRFEFAGLSPARYRVRIVAPRHIAPEEHDVELREGQREERRYELATASQITLTIIDDFNEAVVSAIATVKNAATDQRVTTPGGALRSDARGQLRIPGIPPGTYTITLTRSGYLVKDVTVNVAAGESATQTVQLEKIVR